MITKEYYQTIGLTDEQTKKISKALGDEQRLRTVILKCGIAPHVCEKILSKTDSSKLERMDDTMLTELVKKDWSEFIINRKDKK